MFKKFRLTVTLLIAMLLLFIPTVVLADVTTLIINPSRNPVGTGEAFNFFVTAVNGPVAVNGAQISFTLTGPGEITDVTGQGNCSVSSTTSATCTNVNIIGTNNATVSWLVDVTASSDSAQCGVGGQTITLAATLDEPPIGSDSGEDNTSSNFATCTGTPTAVTLSSLQAYSVPAGLPVIAVVALSGMLGALVLWRRRH